MTNSLDELLELKALADHAEQILGAESFNRLWQQYIEVLKENMIISETTIEREAVHGQYKGALGFLEHLNGTIANWQNNEDQLKEFETVQKIDNN